jgi:YgiT-type zinc finger domain-containing protein
VCKGTIKDGFSSYTADIDNHVIVIRNVPAHICEQCGDTCYDTEIVKRLEEIINSLTTQAHAEIAVVSYTAQAA